MQTVRLNGSRRSRNGHVNGHSIVLPEPAKITQPEPWRLVLDNTDVGPIVRLTIEAMMPHIISATDEWAMKVKSFEFTEEKKHAKKSDAAMKAELKKFFALNPFGCRNQKMLELLSILLKCPLKDIKPAQVKGEEDGDGASDGPNVGLIALAPIGTAIKVIGGRKNLRERLTNQAVNQIFFWHDCDENYYAKCIRPNGAVFDVKMQELVETITPMPEHYIPAPPEEVVGILLKSGFDSLKGLCNTLIPEKIRRELYRGAGDTSSKRKSGDDEEGDSDSDDDEEL